MADTTAIAWTDHTFNPWIGCQRVSPGCENCYAERLASEVMNKQVWGPTNPRSRTSKSNWNNVLLWDKHAGEEGFAHIVFCASLADVFEDREDLIPWRDDLFSLIKKTGNLDWQLLTKRPENIERMIPDDWDDFSSRIWIGTSVENERYAYRAPIVARIPASVHFISYEPALGPIDHAIDLTGIQWLIYGGESGPGYRPHDVDWARRIRAKCEAQGVAFFYKQSAARRTEMGIRLDGEIVRNYPWQHRRPVGMRPLAFKLDELPEI